MMIRYNKNRSRTSHLQVKITERNNKVLLDEIETLGDDETQASLLRKALTSYFKIEVKPEPHIALIMSKISALVQGQNEMMAAIQKLKSGSISVQEFGTQAQEIQKKSADSLNILDGAKDFSSAFFTLDDDELYDDES